MSSQSYLKLKLARTQGSYDAVPPNQRFWLATYGERTFTAKAHGGRGQSDAAVPLERSRKRCEQQGFRCARTRSQDKHGLFCQRVQIVFRLTIQHFFLVQSVSFTPVETDEGMCPSRSTFCECGVDFFEGGDLEVPEPVCLKWDRSFKFLRVLFCSKQFRRGKSRKAALHFPLIHNHTHPKMRKVSMPGYSW